MVMTFNKQHLQRRVFVRVAPSGAWIIFDERDHRGGRFRDREAAMRFIRREFGPEVELVMWTPSTELAA
jgi:hypothetical protein